MQRAVEEARLKLWFMEEPLINRAKNHRYMYFKGQKL